MGRVRISVGKLMTFEEFKKHTKDTFDMNEAKKDEFLLKEYERNMILVKASLEKSKNDKARAAARLKEIEDSLDIDASAEAEDEE